MNLQPRKDHNSHQYPTLEEYRSNRRPFLKRVLKVAAVMVASVSGLLACSQKKVSSDTCPKSNENLTPLRSPGVPMVSVEKKTIPPPGEPPLVTPTKNDPQNIQVNSGSCSVRDSVVIKDEMRTAGKPVRVNKQNNKK